jgi:hypothetical protein
MLVVPTEQINLKFGNLNKKLYVCITMIKNLSYSLYLSSSLQVTGRVTYDIEEHI